jgi:hypothetical protein
LNYRLSPVLQSVMFHFYPFYFAPALESYIGIWLSVKKIYA